MKIINIILRIVLALLIVSPILGVTGVFPAPTADMYNTPEAFSFIQVVMMSASYISWIMAVVFLFTIYLIVTNRMALAAILILPITVNIIAFHAFLDGGLFTAGAVMANVLVLINVYFLWQNRAQYRSLWQKSATASTLATAPQP